MTKRCTKCGETKPVSEFAKHIRASDGLQYWCRECKAEHQRANRHKEKEYHDRWVAKNPSGPRKSARNWEAKNPGAKVCHCRLKRAVESGAVSKPDACEMCGNNERKLHAHHDTYIKDDALRVIWLCAVCHKFIHNQRKVG